MMCQSISRPTSVERCKPNEILAAWGGQVFQILLVGSMVVAPPWKRIEAELAEYSPEEDGNHRCWSSTLGYSSTSWSKSQTNKNSNSTCAVRLPEISCTHPLAVKAAWTDLRLLIFVGTRFVRAGAIWSNDWP
jgi:hypothetical protein